MKSGKIKIMIFLVLSAVIVVAVLGYAIYRQRAQEETSMGKNAVFVSENPAFDFTFEYPSKEWSLQEEQGRRQKYNAVYLRGPIDSANDFATIIAITVKPLGEAKGASELLGAYLEMSSNLPKFKVLNKNDLSIGGEKAVSALYEQEMLLPRETLNAKPVAVNGHTVFLVKNEKAYEFTFLVIADQDKDYLPIFAHILKTFKFQK